MLKFLFWSLLLANAALAAHQLGYLDAVLPDGHEPTRMDLQINPQRLRLVPAPPAEADVPAEAPVNAEPAAPPGPAASQTAPGEQTLAAAPELIACVEVGNFSPDAARRFSAQLGPLRQMLTQRPVQEVASHMVYMPPQGDRESAEKKAGELRQLGVADFFIIQDNSALRWGISLGVFKTEEAARGYLAALGQKGVRSARIGQRSVTSNNVAFQFRNLDGAAKSALDAIKAGFARQEMRDCPPAAGA